MSLENKAYIHTSAKPKCHWKIKQPIMSRATITCHTISTSYGSSDIRVFEPADAENIQGTIVTVHPWSFLGGGEHNTVGLARFISSIAKSRGWRVITFTLKSTPLYLGGAIGGILLRHYHEVNHIVEVAEWTYRQYHTGDNIKEAKHLVLLGSSAGAPYAGSAMEKVQQKQTQVKMISAFIAVGYTFGNFAWLGFGRHFSSVVGSSTSSFCGSASSSTQDVNIAHKLFIMGENDEFTSVEQLERMVAKMKAVNSSCRVDMDIVPDVGHFELESPSYDPIVAEKVIRWLGEVL